MRMIESIMRDIRHNRLRNFLSAATMFIGVVSIVAISAAGTMAADMLVAAEEQRNGRAATYQQGVSVEQSAAAGVAEQLCSSLARCIGPGNAAAVASVVTAPSWYTSADAYNLPAGQGVTAEWGCGDLTKVKRLPIVSGTFPLPADPLPPSVAVNEAAADEFGYPQRAQVYLGEANSRVSFRITSVVADGAGYPQVYGTVSSLDLFAPAAGPVAVTVRFTSAGGDADVIRQVMADAFVDAGLAVPDGFERVDTVGQVADEIEALEAIFTGVSVLMLVVAGLGILNVGLSSVAERSSELVIRRAIGAKRHQVFALVMGAEIVVAVATAVAAIVFALAGVYYLVPSLQPPGSAVAEPPFPWAACLVGIAAAVATAVAGSAAPAWKASRIPVSQALRE